MTPEELLEAEVAFSVVSRLLYMEPSDEEATAYMEPGMFSAAPFAMTDAATVKGLGLMERWCDHCRDEIAQGETTLHACAADLRRDWLNLLVGAGEPKAPSWAGYYLNPSNALLGQSALEVRRLYQLHGYRLERVNQEPDDNLGIMLGFMAVLIKLEREEPVEGAANDDAPAKCQERLLQEFILPWLPLWRWSVERFARTDFYRGLGDMVFGIVRTYAERFGFVYREGEGDQKFVKAERE